MVLGVVGILLLVLIFLVLLAGLFIILYLLKKSKKKVIPEESEVVMKEEKPKHSKKEIRYMASKKKITTKPKQPDEHYDRREKQPDETFCYSCGSVIKKEAEICPKCGVRNKYVDGGKPKGSIFWLIFWIVVFWPIAIIYALIRRWK